ncbi:MAG: hypothetical protein U1F11_03440 [Steroidobacteraceae bacterium]
MAVSRRTWLRSACGGAVLLCAGRAAVADGPKKFTREQAEYKETAPDDLACVACALFVEPKFCTIVEGEVSPRATCKYFVPVE